MAVFWKTGTLVWGRARAATGMMPLTTLASLVTAGVCYAQGLWRQSVLHVRMGVGMMGVPLARFVHTNAVFARTPKTTVNSAV